MKWTIGIAFAVGIMMVLDAMRRDSTSSFNDGTFLIQIVEGLGGGVLVVGSIIAFIVILFMGLK